MSSYATLSSKFIRAHHMACAGLIATSSLMTCSRSSPGSPARTGARGAPQHHLLRDRDGSFGPAYRGRIRAMGLRDHPTAPRSPWQNGQVERIGSIRRECLDHLVVFGEANLRRALKSYASDYNQAARTHLSLCKDVPLFRRRQTVGNIASIPILGGLDHHSVRV